MRRVLPLLVTSLVLALPALLSGCGDGDRTATRPRTLVLLTLDALRRDHVGHYTPKGASPRARTPVLDALFAEGTTLEDARTPVPLTLPAHATMLSGLPPAETGVRVNTMQLQPAATRSFALLPERLRGAGWRTGAFVSASTLARDRGLDAGFEVYDDGDLGAVTGSLMVPERKGDETITALGRFLGSLEAQESAFCFVHLFEPHHPYVTGSYRGDVEDCDRVVGALLATLESHGRGDAVLLITADHGEALGELGEQTHGILLADGVLRVPMTITGGDVPPSSSQAPADVADVAPTLAALAGVDFSREGAVGRGVDLLAGEAAPGRIRIAESLYGHHRYGWAQLSGAVWGSQTIVEAGGTRVFWLPQQPFSKDLPGVLTPPASLETDLRAMQAALGRYKSREASGLMQASAGAGGYGAGGEVAPFLPQAENVRLPDPYLFVANADLLNAIAARTGIARANRDEAALDQLARDLRRLQRADPRNKEAAFRMGRIQQALAGLAPGLAEARRRLEAAEKAYGRAWELGRRDAGTLIALCGVNAKGNEQVNLARLETLGASVRPWTCQIWLLVARLRQGAGDEPGFREACEEARKACQGPRGKIQHRDTCGG
jgi:hypothetical protein